MPSWTTEPGVLELPDGRRIRGTGLHRPVPRDGIPPPDFAIILQGNDPGIGSYPYRFVRWRDFWTPSDTTDAVNALSLAYTRAETQRVEIACSGGIGRTGTALSVIAIMAGISANDAVAWVRRHYQLRAVETPMQRRWVKKAARMVSG